MSSLPGESALKQSLLFEFAWTARHLIEVLEDHAQSILIGGIPAEAGVDFRLTLESHEEHHQVKRASGYRNSWTLSLLDEAGVLADFWRRLQNDSVQCHFVSTITAIPLTNLSDRSREADSFAIFEQSYLNGQYRKDFDELVRRWATSGEEAWQKLRRVWARPKYGDDLQ